MELVHAARRPKESSPLAKFKIEAAHRVIETVRAVVEVAGELSSARDDMGALFQRERGIFVAKPFANDVHRNAGL